MGADSCSITAQPLKRFYSDKYGLIATFESVFIQLATNDNSYYWLENTTLHISFYEADMDSHLRMRDITKSDLISAQINNSNQIVWLIESPFQAFLSVAGHPDIRQAVNENMSGGLSQGGPLLSIHLNLASLTRIRVGNGAAQYLGSAMPDLGWVRRKVP
ncbi:MULTISPECIES: hypothetical protein [unclassified Sphingomonas]|jgi:hypothetical protein|uniref:hypothetical protein n=1 Tax=unclassified Sphingomonas TaxID=196159 RepID=UPI0012E3B88E|nr:MULTISPECIES: hypothetical protein [unclassified Sphingomonas]